MANVDAAKGERFAAPEVLLSAPSFAKEGTFQPESARPAEEALHPPPEAGRSGESAPDADPSALLESKGMADIPQAQPELQMPNAPVADGSVPPRPSEAAALILPPTIRPVAIPPPRILSYSAPSDLQAGESPSPLGAESPWLTGLEPASIPPAFAAPSEGATAAEGAVREQAVPPETKLPASEAGAGEGKLGQAAPQNSGKSSGVKTSHPVPPKIALSVPIPPALRNAPVPQAEPESPAPDPILPPPPLPLARFDQDVLQNLFMTDEFLDLSAVCRHVSGLPGIQACVISRRDENVSAGEMPDGFELSELLAFAPGVRQVAGRLPIGALKHFTLYAEAHSVSFFEQHGVCLCVVHRARSFIPGVREKLVTVADELSKS